MATLEHPGITNGIVAAATDRMCASEDKSFGLLMGVTLGPAAGFFTAAMRPTGDPLMDFSAGIVPVFAIFMLAHKLVSSRKNFKAQRAFIKAVLPEIRNGNVSVIEGEWNEYWFATDNGFSPGLQKVPDTIACKRFHRWAKLSPQPTSPVIPSSRGSNSPNLFHFSTKTSTAGRLSSFLGRFFRYSQVVL